MCSATARRTISVMHCSRLLHCSLLLAGSFCMSCSACAGPLASFLDLVSEVCGPKLPFVGVGLGALALDRGPDPLGRFGRPRPGIFDVRLEPPTSPSARTTRQATTRRPTR